MNAFHEAFMLAEAEAVDMEGVNPIEGALELLEMLPVRVPAILQKVAFGIVDSRFHSP